MFNKMIQIANISKLTISLISLCCKVKSKQLFLAQGSLEYDNLCSHAAAQVHKKELPEDLYKEFFSNHNDSFEEFYKWWQEEEAKK